MIGTTRAVKLTVARWAAREQGQGTMRVEDRELVGRLLDGDPRSFRAFFDDYFPRLYRFVLRRVGTDQDVAQDIAQVALTRGVQRLASYRAEASLFTWLCQIARNEIADHLARNARRGLATAALLSREDDPAVRAALESIHALSDEEPERQMHREDLRTLVHAALDYLPARYAQILEMKYLDELSVESIAQRLGVTGIAVQSLLARARVAFREASALLSDDFAALGIAAVGSPGGVKP